MYERNRPLTVTKAVIILIQAIAYFLLISIPVGMFGRLIWEMLKLGYRFFGLWNP